MWGCQSDGGRPVCALVELGELVVGRGEAHAESFGFAIPMVLVGFGDPVSEVVANLFQPRPLSWVDAKKWASDTTVFVLAACCVGATAVSERNLRRSKFLCTCQI
jgi:hypothetical protein